MSRHALGAVYLVGAGPGDPGLLTLKAVELLGRADTVLYDRLVHPDSLRHVRPGARLIFCGKEGGGAQVTQEEIHTTLIAQARLGRSVVRLKGGDPFVFGRGGEEALALVKARIPFEVVPGVSSGCAAPAAAGIPVTHRGISAAVTFATAHSTREEPDWEHLARSPTLVLFMGGQRLKAITASLIRAGRSASTPSALIEAGTWEHQRVFEGRLDQIAALAEKHAVGSPSLLLIGEVAALRSELAGWNNLKTEQAGRRTPRARPARRASP
ncbi:MAG: uroporphyrinogen-III C-methyltransferase [Myxococcaceae bacterium]